jgi:formate dehydrogenase subunit beta
MFVQGAKALSSITRLGKSKMMIAAIMRPCETRAAIELAKLGQVDLDNIIIISMDCPGVIPYSDFLKDPDKNIKLFNEAAKKHDDSIMRPTCQICNKSSMISGDLHIGTLGVKNDKFLLISNSKKGDEITNKLGIKLKDNIDVWKSKVKYISKDKSDKRKNANKKLKLKIGGIDNLVDNFIHCINCHNCMKVCPVCICRLCYFDSDQVKLPSEDYISKAEAKGSIRFLPDTTFFQIGRMMHMSISCVSCGSCEDACPMSIPVGQIFSMISDETQGLFDYVSGRSIDEKIPICSYKEDELLAVEDAND